MIYILIFISGICLGSFYNVVGMRALKNESIIKPASHCPKCHHHLKWYELIPILSYLFLRGKCRQCKAHISLVYPLIELLTGILFIFSYLKFGFSLNFIIAIIIASILVIIYLTDFSEYIILDLTLIIGVLAIATLQYMDIGINFLYGLLNGLGLFIFMYLVKLVGDKIFKRESLGGGDIKLSFLIGQVIGWQLGLVSLIVASFLAFPYALIVSTFKHQREVPFGPFLITALLIIFFKIDLFQDVLNILLRR